MALAQWRKILKTIGPGIITGASDDDPSGIVTYAVAGAQHGFGLLWTALFSFPLMGAVQEMCARIGIVTNHGLAGVLRKHYSRPLLIVLALLVVVSNTINIGADLGGMAEAAALVLPVHPLLLCVFFAGGIALGLVFLPYRKIARVMKWLTLALFAYILAAFLAHPDWRVALLHTFVPTFSWNKETIMTLVAILGTTISPYLFFWQAAEEVEEREENEPFRVKHSIVTKTELHAMREDVWVGMLLSNLVMFFIIVNAAAVFHAQGITELTSAGQVASSLAPFAGSFASLIFALGVVGTGALAIPVLAGSTAYVVAEAFGWQEGLNKTFSQARAFYGVIILSTVAGLCMNLFRIPAMQALFATAVIYGLVSPPLVGIILHIANQHAIMGNKKNGWAENVMGGLALLVLTSAAGAFAWFSLT